MAKPIFLIQCPYRSEIKKIRKIENDWSERMPDWHVIFSMNLFEGVKFTAFSENNATDIEIESLKKELLEKIG